MTELSPLITLIWQKYQKKKSYVTNDQKLKIDVFEIRYFLLHVLRMTCRWTKLQAMMDSAFLGGFRLRRCVATRHKLLD